jgi:hypothetical protein
VRFLRPKMPFAPPRSLESPVFWALPRFRVFGPRHKHASFSQVTSLDELDRRPVHAPFGHPPAYIPEGPVSGCWNRHELGERSGVQIGVQSPLGSGPLAASRLGIWQGSGRVSKWMPAWVRKHLRGRVRGGRREGSGVPSAMATQRGAGSMPGAPRRCPSESVSNRSSPRVSGGCRDSSIDADLEWVSGHMPNRWSPRVSGRCRDRSIGAHRSGCLDTSQSVVYRGVPEVQRQVNWCRWNRCPDTHQDGHLPGCSEGAETGQLISTEWVSGHSSNRSSPRCRDRSIHECAGGYVE